MQAEFATRFLQRLRLWGVSCAIETAGDAPASKLRRASQQAVTAGEIVR